MTIIVFNNCASIRFFKSGACKQAVVRLVLCNNFYAAMCVHEFMTVFVCVCVCVCVHPGGHKNSDMIWTSYDWLNNSCCFSVLIHCPCCKYNTWACT